MRLPLEHRYKTRNRVLYLCLESVFRIQEIFVGQPQVQDKTHAKVYKTTLSALSGKLAQGIDTKLMFKCSPVSIKDGFKVSALTSPPTQFEPLRSAAWLDEAKQYRVHTKARTHRHFPHQKNKHHFWGSNRTVAPPSWAPTTPIHHSVFSHVHASSRIGL